MDKTTLVDAVTIAKAKLDEAVAEDDVTASCLALNAAREIVVAAYNARLPAIGGMGADRVRRASERLDDLLREYRAEHRTADE